MKKFVVCFLTVAMFVTSMQVLALADNSVCDEVEVTEAFDEQIFSETIPTINPLGQFGEFYYRSNNVKTTYYWGPAIRVSNNVKCGATGGSISCTESKDFVTTVTGNIQGLGISTSAKVSSSVGYTLNLDPNTTEFMAFSVYYKCVTGTREKVSQMSGKVVGTNTYKVVTPMRGEYSLVRVS